MAICKNCTGANQFDIDQLRGWCNNCLDHELGAECLNAYCSNRSFNDDGFCDKCPPDKETSKDLKVRKENYIDYKNTEFSRGVRLTAEACPSCGGFTRYKSGGECVGCKSSRTSKKDIKRTKQRRAIEDHQEKIRLDKEDY